MHKKNNILCKKKKTTVSLLFSPMMPYQLLLIAVRRVGVFSSSTVQSIVWILATMAHTERRALRKISSSVFLFFVVCVSTVSNKINDTGKKSLKKKKTRLGKRRSAQRVEGGEQNIYRIQQYIQVIFVVPCTYTQRVF